MSSFSISTQIARMKSDYRDYAAQRSQFLRLHINATLLLSIGYLAVFAYLDSWFSFGTVAGYFTLILYVKYRAGDAVTFEKALAVAVSFTVVPLICVLLSGGIASPYLAWVVTPVFAAFAIVGSRIVLPLSVLIVAVFIAALSASRLLEHYNELPADMYQPMAVLSVLSASAFLALFVRMHSQFTRTATQDLIEAVGSLEERNLVLRRAGFTYVAIAVKDYRILDCDAEWANLVYAPFPDCIGQDRRQYFRSPEGVQRFERLVATVRFDTHFTDVEATQDLEGRARFVERFALRVQAGHGYPEHVKLFNRVVTDEVVQRQRLENALNSLENINRKNHQMYGVIAHELRTPVAAIEMMSHHDMTQWAADQKTIRGIAQDLIHSIDDMKMLVNPELKRPVRYSNITLDQLNTAIQSMVTSTVSATDMAYRQTADVTSEVGAELFTTDSYRVKAAVVNLIRNACLHSEGSVVECTSFITEGVDGQRFAGWSVVDDGKGIPEEKVPSLFQPFQRGDTQADGTGLGLHIAKTWIDELGGSLSYKALEPGSEFKVMIPLLSPDIKAGAEPLQTRRRDTEQRAQQLRVLYVEDDKVLQLVSSKLMQKLFKSVDLATDGVEGLDKAQRGNYDLIMTDFFMPNMTGVQMTAELRKIGLTTPIVGVTAATIAGQRQEMLDAGVNSVLFKPINADALLQEVDRLISKGFFTGCESRSVD